MRHPRSRRAALTLALTLVCLPFVSPSTAGAESTYRAVLCQAQAFLSPGAPIPDTHNPNLGRPGIEFHIHRLSGSSAPGMTTENASELCSHPNRFETTWFGALIHNHPPGWPRTYSDDQRRDMAGGEGAGLKWTLPEGLAVRRVSWQAAGVGVRFGPGRLRLRPGFIGGGWLDLRNPADPPSGRFEAASLASDPRPAEGFGLIVECETDPRSRCDDSSYDLALIRNIEFTLLDQSPPRLDIHPAPFIDGHWSAGIQPVRINITEQGSGLHSLTATLDGNTVAERNYNCHAAAYAGAAGGRIATMLSPCPTGQTEETLEIDTRNLPDGAHRLEICALDYAAHDETFAAGQPVCRDRIVRTDNTPPEAPTQAQIAATTASRQSVPEDVSWPDPGKDDPGSAIRTATYEIRDGSGRRMTGPVSVSTEGREWARASDPSAQNVDAIPALHTPEPAGEYELLVSVTDLTGHTSQTVVRRLAYACEDSGSDRGWWPKLAIGLTRAGRKPGTAKSRLSLNQGRRSRLTGEIANPASHAAPQTRICLGTRLHDQTEMSRFSAVQSDINGRFDTALPAGPSRQIQAIHRRGHRETYSDPAHLNVTARPALRPQRHRIWAGQKLRFKGRIPGPKANGRGVILQAKAGKSWLVFQRATTRKSGRYSFTYRPNVQGITRPTRFTIRSLVPRQAGYPYAAGTSRQVRILIQPSRNRSR